jgi:hypothetical protein
MASTFSDLLQLETMVQGEQDNTWGDKTTDNLEKLEQAISGRIGIALAASDYTLTAVNGGDGSGSTNPANLILDCSGVLTANVNIIAPNVTGMYIVKNGTTGAFTVGIKTAAGSALEIAQGETLLVWCNGTDVFSTISAISTGTISLATNSLQLGGIVAAAYAQLAVKNSWTRPQTALGQDVTLTAGTYTPNADVDTNLFIAQAEVTQNVTIANPTGTPTKGQVITIQIEQHGSTVRSLTWGSKFIFTDDVNVNLTQTVNKVDVFTMQYNANLDRWLVAGVAQNFPRT